MSKRQKPDQKQLFNSLGKDFHELVSNKATLRTSVDHFLSNLIDELTLGIIFDTHRKHKTSSYNLEVEVENSLDDDVATTDADIFSQHNMKKTPDCVCPNCERAVAAARFAPHLENCMGMGRTSRSRNATRRVVTDSKDRDNSSYSGVPSDDEDDVDWNSGDKRRKKKDRNGSKKSKGTPKKSQAPEPSESLNVDVEGDDDDLTILRDILHLQDYSNSLSPGDSASSSGSSKKKDKSKTKKSVKRDRSSPSSSIVD